MKRYSIGQIAKIVGLSPKTIRFYETAGVAPLPERGENGYRFYQETAVEELRILKYARDLGLPLGEIKKLIKGCEGGNCQHSKAYIEESVNDYLSLLGEKIEQMNKLKDRLESLRDDLEKKGECRQKGPYCCDILHQLLSIH